MFVTSQGSAHGRFERAIRRGQLLAAETAARELGRLSLEDAFELCVLMARHGDRRFKAAAVRWHGRYAVERAPSLPQSAAVLAALAQLPDDEALFLLRAALRRR
jgi:hypothetical protein